MIGVVNTHEHFDHTFGNGAFRAAYGAVPIHAHEIAAEQTVPGGRADQGAVRRRARRPARATRCSRPRSCLPDRTFSSRASSLDLGDRPVELVHPGRGHTGGDLVVRVPDADVLLAGDLVEESAPRRSVRRRLLPAGLAAEPRHRARPEHVRRPSSCRATARRSTATSSRSSATTIGIVAETIRDLADPRRARSTRRSTRPSGRGRGGAWRPPYAVATSSSRAARSGCRSSERGTCLGMS